MKIWILLYLAVFVIFSIVGIVDDFRDKRPRWFLALAGVSNLIIIVFFLGYWNQSWLPELGIWAGVLFIAAIAWEGYQAILDFGSPAVESNSEEDGGRATAIVGILVYAAICLPAFIVAGMTAFQQ